VDVRDGQIEFRRKEARVAAAGGWCPSADLYAHL